VAPKPPFAFVYRSKLLPEGVGVFFALPRSGSAATVDSGTATELSVASFFTGRDRPPVLHSWADQFHGFSGKPRKNNCSRYGHIEVGLALASHIFYSFRLDEAVPGDHPLRESAAGSRSELGAFRLAPHYPPLGRPSIDRVLTIRMLIVGYVFAIRSERALCRELRVNLAYRWFL
jgi:hypothetical protein